MKNTFLFILLIPFICLSCSFLDPVSKAQSLLRQGKFNEAITILEAEQKKKPKSVPLKSILAKAYSDHGLALCQDPDKPPKVKYNLAKEQFQKALALNPYLTDAKDMLEMIEKIQAHLAESMIE